MTLDELRTEGAARFASAAEPVFKYGLNVLFTAKEAVLPFATSSAAGSRVRVPDGVRVLSVAEALAEDAMRFFALPALITDERAAKIAAWHQANAGAGTVIVVPDGMTLAEPIRIDLELADAALAENILVIAGVGSTVTVVEHLRSSPDLPTSRPHLRSSVTDLVAMPSSRVTHISLQDFATNVSDLSLRRSRVQENASVTWIECAFGGGFAQSIVSTDLLEEGASVEAKTMFFGGERQRFDMLQKARHAASHTRSSLITRGALADEAKAVYRGLVRIEKGTKGAEGRQKEDTLLLGARAEIDAIPNLEIESEDVRCSHGASVGRLHPEKLFYLMSRGLDEKSARAFLVNGFFAPVVEQMRSAGLEDRVQCVIDERGARLAD